MKNTIEKTNEAYLRYYSGTGLVHVRRFFRYPLKFILRGLSRIGLFNSLKPIRATTFWGTDIFVLLPDSDAGSLFYFGFLANREYKLTRFLMQNIKSDDIFYDVGANYGFYAALAKNFIQQGEVHLFEPHPLLFACIQKTMKGINDIFLNNVALSNTVGDISFFDGYEKGNSGLSTSMSKVAEQKPEQFKRITVRSITLDAYVVDNAAPTVIKIDVEGGEYDVLKGAEKMIRDVKPMIIAELWGGANWSMYAQPVVELLHSWGYIAYSIDKEGILHMQEVSELEGIISSASYDNIVFIAK